MTIFKNYLENLIQADADEEAAHQPIRGTYTVAVVAGTGAFRKLSWAETGGVIQDGVLDLSNPEQPIGTVAGLYIVTVSLFPGGDTINFWQLDLILDASGEAQEVNTYVTPQTGDEIASTSLSYLMPEAGVITLQVNQSSGGDIGFGGKAYVVVIPTL